MTLIEEIVINGQSIKLFNGVDFDILINHSKDGLDGFIFCFVDNYKSEIKQYNRQKKIDSVVNQCKYRPFEWKMIENNFISVYQTDGIGCDVVYETVKDKLLKNQFYDMPWLQIAGIRQGAWKIA